MAKNLYNTVNYQIRQTFFDKENPHYLKLFELWKVIKPTQEYESLPRKVSNQIIRDVYRDWLSYYNAVKSWRKNPEKFKSRPQIPNYKPKKDGRSVLTYEQGAINTKKMKREGIISPSGLKFSIKTNKKAKMLRIVPRKGFFVLEIIYEKEKTVNENLDKNKYLGVDFGVSNLATLTLNEIGFRPKVVKGSLLKTENQYYNKEVSRMQSRLAENKTNEQHTSKRIQRITEKRNRKIQYLLHCASKKIIEICLANNIGMIVIGKNDGWKQESNMGSKNNQNFVQIPFSKLISMIQYKAELQGIDIFLTEEAYTSKCSFYDQEPMQHSTQYLGVRKGRFYRRPNGQIIHADVQGSFNITRKVFPRVFDEFYEYLSNAGGIVDALTGHPLSIKLSFN